MSALFAAIASMNFHIDALNSGSSSYMISRIGGV